jgi:hypothetical protein
MIWARITCRWGRLRPRAQLSNNDRSNRSNTIEEAVLLIANTITAPTLYVKLYLTHYTSVRQEAFLVAALEATFRMVKPAFAYVTKLWSPAALSSVVDHLLRNVLADFPK